MAARKSRSGGLRMGTYAILFAVLVALGLAAWVAMSDPREDGPAQATAQSDQPPPAADVTEAGAPDGAAVFVESEVEAPAGGRVPLFYETGTTVAGGD